MDKPVQAIYEQGVFKPLCPVELQEGQKVNLAVEPLALTLAEADDQLAHWAQVYGGLTDADLIEVEQVALDRSHFLRASTESP